MKNLYNMKTKIFALLFLSIFIIAGCKTFDDKDKVKITILQLNDVYEMSPVSGGKLGGLARVQTLLKKLRKENPNTITVLSGDLLSPSAIGTAKFKGTDQKFAGMQMVDILNYMGWDYFTFGNHEFDLKEPDLLRCLDSMKFKTIIDNVVRKDSEKIFRNTELNLIREIEGVSIGIFGVMTDGYEYDYATVSDPIEAAKKAVENLREKSDIILGITHLNIDEDIKLVTEITGIDMVMGGHEHENYHLLRGDKFVPINKADANAKTAYVHQLTYDKKTKALRIESELVFIDSSFKADPEIDKLVQKWTNLAFDYFEVKFNGDPKETVGVPTVTLDGTEASVRSRSTKLTELITKGFYNYYKDSTEFQVDAAIMNGGSIRIDDKLPADKPVTLYDIIRISPFGGTISLVKIDGKYLKEALDIGDKSVSSGAFLQYYNISKSDNKWIINGEEINNIKSYNIAISTYVVDVGDIGLDILTTEKGETTKIDAPEPPFANVVKIQFSKDYPIKN
jgi:5'-nucleotidase